MILEFISKVIAVTEDIIAKDYNHNDISITYLDEITICCLNVIRWGVIMVKAVRCDHIRSVKFQFCRALLR